MPQILLLGQHGSGKTTLGRELARRDNAVFLSAGELIRAEVERRSLAGLAEALADGEDAPEELSYGLLARELERRESVDQLVVLDGYPRYARQLDRLQKALGGQPAASVVLEAPTPMLVHRARTRLVCPDCGAIYGEAVAPNRAGACDGCRTRLINRPEDNDMDRLEKRHLAWRKDGPAIVFGLERVSPVFRVNATQTPLRVLGEVHELLVRL